MPAVPPPLLGRRNGGAFADADFGNAMRVNVLSDDLRYICPRYDPSIKTRHDKICGSLRSGEHDHS
jgi:hypothetical protein